jgi:hypothetical protein
VTVGLNVTVIGTSNSILRGGWSYGLRESPHVEVFNIYSLGFSTTVLLPKVMAEPGLADSDFVLLDFEVNEEDAIFWKQAGVEEIRGRVLDFIVRALPAKAIPVFVSMPCTRHIGKQTSARQLYSALARELGVPYFDCYEFLDKVLGPHADGWEVYFLDPAHMKPPYAYEFGKRITESLARIDRTAIRRAERTEMLKIYSYRWIVDSAPINCERFVRKTSLVEECFVRMRPGDLLTFGFDTDVNLVAIGVNIAQSDAAIIVTSESGTSTGQVNLRTHHFIGDGQRLDYVVMQFTALRGRVFTVTVQAPENGDGLAEFAGFTFAGEDYAAQVPVWHGLAYEWNHQPLSRQAVS